MNMIMGCTYWFNLALCFIMDTRAPVSLLIFVTGDARNTTTTLHACWSCVGCGAQQEFFYHVLLVLDSYTFNSHLKAELVAKIARLYQQLNTFKGRRTGVGNVDERGAASDTSNPAVNKGVRGFTGTMVKLKVRRM